MSAGRFLNRVDDDDDNDNEPDDDDDDDDADHGDGDADDADDDDDDDDDDDVVDARLTISFSLGCSTMMCLRRVEVLVDASYLVLHSLHSLFPFPRELNS
jgi:ABC-type Zn2+ transport system substrate-binding protein/surface adhesin